ncbi:MAG: hypothetical protein L6V93_02515 [Clostridiales bacterium]|nr:MAG: hypothetical protein L6V93_02515 [Clostridiales bacterium]
MDKSLQKLVTDAGADIIECNFSCPQMVGEGLGSDVGQKSRACKEVHRMCEKKERTFPCLQK